MSITVHLVSLGCPKNLVDSEVFLGNILSDGFRLSADPEEADVLMVNTCGFIDRAKEESVDSILELCAHKQEDPDKKVVVTGCLGQRYPQQLVEEVPEIDAIIGLSEYGRMADILRGLTGTERTRVEVEAPVHPAYSEGSRLRLTPRHTTYLRTSEGCDNPCTFCSIPSFRGKFRSKSVDDVIAEAHELVASGATEINLISQDLTSYGVDLDGTYHLAKLLERLNDVDGLRWIRLLYTYPKKFSDEMIDAVAQLERVVPYIDMPIQHIDDRILKRMGRRMNEAGTRGLFARMRERIPGLVLRTTFIVGFPGETDQEFENLLGFVRESKIERVGVFTYSDEDGTPATKLDGKVPESVQQNRQEQLMLAQQEVAFAWNARRVGEELDILIDSADAASGRMLGRSFAEAPEIDGHISLPPTAGKPGDYVRARIQSVDAYDLEAVPL